MKARSLYLALWVLGSEVAKSLELSGDNHIQSVAIEVHPIIVQPEPHPLFSGFSTLYHFLQHEKTGYALTYPEK